MSRRSVKENKSAYQLSREAAGLTREAAEELTFISSDRIERIESGRSAAHPDEVLAMERGYCDAKLANHYCTHECPIGMKYETEARLSSLPQLTVELLSALRAMDEEKDGLIDISVDGRVTGGEREQFDRILNKLASLDRSIRGMRMWLENAMMNGVLEEAEE